MIDWVTFRVSLDHFDLAEVLELRSKQDKVFRVTGDGVPVWETVAWDSIRSDSHQLTYRITSDFVWVQGSPSRVIADGDNVFSSGASAACDLVGCVRVMIAHIADCMGLAFPSDLSLYLVSRVDVTFNLVMADLPEVRQALALLRNVEGGRYRVSQQAGDTVYWSHKSRLKSGKAYAKGPHLLHLMRKPADDYQGRIYQSDEIFLVNRLLRLELKLGAQYWRERTEKAWHLFTADDLFNEWNAYFDRMIGGVEVTDDESLKDRIFKIAPTEGRAKAAYGCWALIKTEGWERAREMQSKSTWYRNLQILRDSGMSDADLSKGTVVMLRKKVMSVQIVKTWSDLRNVA